MTQCTIETLSEAECFELIGGEVVGRFVFEDVDGPAAVPVNFGLAGKEILFRTEQASHLREVLGRPVAFEVDLTDPDIGSGWSVLVRGVGREVELDRLPELLRHAGKTLPHPWGEGIHNVWVSIMPKKVTGRRLTTGFVPAIL
jgi:nitroimidazol reductase NimA-like FMN-containing flavoprotein (pyridoxamine 5'-phosphate oxidase superfamily)